MVWKRSRGDIRPDMLVANHQQSPTSKMLALNNIWRSCFSVVYFHCAKVERCSCAPCQQLPNVSKNEYCVARWCETARCLKSRAFLHYIGARVDGHDVKAKFDATTRLNMRD